MTIIFVNKIEITKNNIFRHPPRVSAHLLAHSDALLDSNQRELDEITFTTSIIVLPFQPCSDLLSSIK
jgi:hypothetical protein